VRAAELASAGRRFKQARITHLLDPTLLAPDLQEHALGLESRRRRGAHQRASVLTAKIRTCGLDSIALTWSSLDTGATSGRGETNVDQEILTIQGLAGYLQIDEKTAYRMAQAGELPGFKVRRQWRFKRVDIDLWIESRKKTTAPPRSNDMPTRAMDQAHPVAVPQRSSPTKNRGG